MALSRDDAGRFLPEYVDHDKAAIFARDPFEVLDQDGVGMLVDWAVKRSRSVKPKLKIGICGEHGGEMESVKFCHRVGMDYVSCSPYRVPIARLAAAQAVIEGESATKKRTRKPSKVADSARRPTGKKKTAKSSRRASGKPGGTKAGRVTARRR